MAEAPAVRALDEIHRQAVLARASDVHIEPHIGGGRIRQRVDGIFTSAAAFHPTFICTSSPALN